MQIHQRNTTDSVRQTRQTFPGQKKPSRAMHAHVHLRHRIFSQAIDSFWRSGAIFESTSRQVSALASGFPASVANLEGTRGLLRLAGAEVLPFLQGLLTNDITTLQKPGAPAVYAALLNAQGRQLHDMFLYRLPGQDTILVADVDAKTLPALKKKLFMYKLRSQVDIAEVSDEYSVWVRFGQDRLPTELWKSDPRLPELGQRILSGKLENPAAPDGEPEVDAQEYERWRIEHGVAEGDTEIPSGSAMPLEYNMDALGAISYSKGCYVGQELVARTHNRGVVRKRLMPVIIHGSEVGKMRAVAGAKGLAHLRLRQGLQAAEGLLQLSAGDAGIVPVRPAWWNPLWGHEEDAA